MKEQLDNEIRIKDWLSYYTDFSGRVSRREYFEFVLASTCIALFLAFLTLINFTFIYFFKIFGLLIIVPVFSMHTRRVHDFDISGWNPLYLVLSFPLNFIIPGDSDSNSHGEPPKPLQSYTEKYIDKSNSFNWPQGLALFFFLDSSFGLRSQGGLFSYFIHGDPLWIIQFFEYIISSMFLLYSFLNLFKGVARTVFTFLSPILILLIFAFCLDQLFIGQETTASTSFNLSSTFFSGLYWGSAYLSIAVGLTIIYKVQKFGNFAQAEMMLVGAYVGFTMMWSPFFYTIIDGKKTLNIDVKKDEILTWDLLFWACISGFVIAGLLGVLIDRLVYRRFRMKNALPQAMMIASLGVAMIMRGLLYLRYGAEQFLFVPDIDWRLSDSKTEFSHDDSPSHTLGFLGDISWPDWMNQTVRFRFGERTSIKDHSNMDQTACIEESKLDNFSSTWDADSGICTVTEYLSFFESAESSYFLQHTKSALIIGVFGAVILLILMLNRTRLGRQMRAVADNPDLAASSGINVERVHAITAFLAAGMSGFGGVLFGMYVRVNPEVGLSILLPAFSVIVLGTLGSVRGALIAAVIVGLVRSISEPILIGAGSGLDRPSYAAFGEAMPYMFLIAVLMVMPKGLGHALDEWKIERNKNRRKWNFDGVVDEVPERFNVILNSIYFPTFSIFSERISKIDVPLKGTLAILGILQIFVVSILYMYTSGQGTVYYLINYIYLLLEFVGFLMIYVSLAHYQTDMKLYIIDVYFQVKDSSIEQRRILLGSGFFILFLFYGIDYLVGGIGTLYLALDYIFLIAQLFGLLMILFSLFFLVGDLGSILSPTKSSDTTIYGFRSANTVIRKTIDIYPKIWGEVLHRLNLLLIIVALLLLRYEPSIEPSSVRDTESTLYVTEIAYILIIFSFRDLIRFISKAIVPVQKVSGEFMKIAGNHVNFQALVFGILLVSFNHLFWGFILLLYSSNDLVKLASDWYSTRKEFINFEFLPKYGRASEGGSWFTFICILVVLIYIADWLPSVTKFTKSMQISRIIVLVCIFSILAISLNLHTGFTGMTNFGVIFFAGLGAITVSILTVPEERPGGHGWAPILGDGFRFYGFSFGSAILAAVFVSGLAGWLLAYPTANLRMDYFAIVTISLGEIVRISMRAEPLLRAGTGTTAIGISLYNLPLEHWWVSSMDDSVGEWLDLGQAAPYTVLLAAIALLSFASIWIIVEMIQASPWGRILRAIREDEEVTMHHGHNVFQHKAMSLALGAAIAGFGGGLWAWLNSSVLDDFMSPVKSTFLIWAAFIVGGRANNRGMVIGAFIIALTEPLFNLLSAARGDTDSIFHDNIGDIDGALAWFILDIVGVVNSDLSIIEVFGSTNPEKITVNLTYFKLMLIGIVILSSLLISERGLLPEVPKRPENPDLSKSNLPTFIWPLVVISVVILELVLLPYIKDLHEFIRGIF